LSCRLLRPTVGRASASQELSLHILTLMLALNRRVPEHYARQLARSYGPLPRVAGGSVDVPAATALLVGAGHAGLETARLCTALGMTTLGVDARRTAALATAAVKSLRADLH
jgi:phosphoglycerate dehydrogenase-like enzyme